MRVYLQTMPSIQRLIMSHFKMLPLDLPLRLHNIFPNVTGLKLMISSVIKSWKWYRNIIREQSKQSSTEKRAHFRLSVPLWGISHTVAIVSLLWFMWNRGLIFYKSVSVCQYKKGILAKISVYYWQIIDGRIHRKRLPN